MMTAHHQGPIDMATTELRGGLLPDVKRLAQQIIDAQQGEIDQFNQVAAGVAGIAGPVTG